MQRSTRRIAIAFALALASLLPMAVPASAEETLIPCQGVCGYYELADTDSIDGARCNYRSGSGVLAWISARPPTMWGYYSQNSSVAWRFKIRRLLSDGATELPWATIYTSSYQSSLANNSNRVANAGNGFSSRKWYGSGDRKNASYVVWIEMRWMLNGHVDGFARVELKHYKVTWGSMVIYNFYGCGESTE